MSKIHYAQSDMTICGKEIGNWQSSAPMIQHTTLPESITCKKCRQIVEDEKSLAKYLKMYNIDPDL